MNLRAHSLRIRCARLVVQVGRPVNLAALRIVTTAMILAAPETREAARWAMVSPELRAPPPGLSWIAAHLPASAALGSGALLVLQVSALLGLMGLATRPALAVATLASLVLLGVPQLYGTVTHHHHLVWFLALLAASPSGDVLSLDSALRARRGEPPPARSALAYAVPLLAVWLLLGIVFFFPGLWKLRTSGVAWFWSDNLRNQMYAKWLQADFVPALRVDRSPLLCRLAALAVVVFELSFGALVWLRRSRAVAVVCALVFHTLTAAFMRVPFVSLWVTYAVFVDWEPILAFAALHLAPGRLAAGARASPRSPARWPRAACAVSAVLVIGNLAAGALGIVSWPFSVYPTFAATVGSEMGALGADALLADGTRVPLVRRATSPRMWGLAWSVLADPSERRLRAYLAELARDPEVQERLRGAQAVRFTRDVLSLDPDHRGKPPLRRTVLAELRL